MKYIKKSTLILSMLLLLAIWAALVFYGRYVELKSSQPPATQDETSLLISQVGRLMVLPVGEIPAIATVTDPEKLIGQLFFANAKKGDKLLLYAQAGKAILYSTADDKIIDITLINNDTTPPVATSTDAVKP